MKNVMLAIFAIFAIGLNAQSDLDMFVLRKVNAYRMSLGLDTLKVNQSCVDAARMQSNHLYTINKNSKDSVRIGHSNLNKKASISNKYAEVIANTKTMNVRVFNSAVLDKMATDVVNGWKSSPSHNAIITDKDFKFAGVSCFILKRESGFVGVYSVDPYSVMVLSI